MSKDPNLVVTLGGRPVPDQALGIRAFKDACLAASKTPPPQAGEWTLTAPDGRTWKAESPLKCCGLEQRERVPANVALARIVEEMERFDAEEAAKAASAPETSPELIQGVVRGSHLEEQIDLARKTIAVWPDDVKRAMNIQD
jgi:hypothetical protein